MGYSLQSKEQKADILAIYVDEKGKPYKTAGKIDYVAGWYFKAAQFMKDTRIRAALVSTNSITQGEQVTGVWKPLFDRFGVHIDFAYRAFKWNSESTDMAQVHVVIVGFSTAENNGIKYIFDGKATTIAKNITPYLVDAPTVFIEKHTKPLCDVPLMTTGNRPADGGNLIIENKDYAEFIKKEPNALPYIKRLVGSEEFINNKVRYCLWLVGISPSELRKLPLVKKRVELCKQDRLASPDAGRRKLANTPTQFRETNNPSSYIAVSEVSSERRFYIPMDFLDKNVICTNKLKIVPNSKIYHFGVLNSIVHMAWARAVCGRLGTGYDYSNTIVYNNFPWPSPTKELRKSIEQTAQGILDARKKFPDSSLADLYDPLTMPPELLKAHEANDHAVKAAYGYPQDITEPEIVADLFKRYQALTSK